MLNKRNSIKAQAGRTAGPLVSPHSGRTKFAPVTLSEQNGVRFLHFGTEWIQGAMRLAQPDWIELQYVQQMMAPMLFNDTPGHVVQLGLGAAALTKFCYRHFPQARVTAVELNPAVISVCMRMFKLPDSNDRLAILQMDAMDFVMELANRASADLLQIDLYDAAARGPVLDTPEFYGACAACLTSQGIAAVNLFGDSPSYLRNLNAMRFAFDSVICLPKLHEGNVIALGFNSAPKPDFSELYRRAENIEATSRLPARSWVNGLKSSLTLTVQA